MENDDSVFIYKTIRDRKPTYPASKGVRITKMHDDIQQKFLKQALSYVKRNKGKGKGRDLIMLEVLHNTLLALLDRLVLASPDEVLYEKNLQRMVKKMKSLDIDMGELLQNWEHDKLKELHPEAKVIDDYIKLLAS